MANTNLRVRELCKMRGITIKELAEVRLNTNYTSFLQALNRNVFSITKLDEIATALGVEIPELFESYQTLPTSDDSKSEGCVCPKCGARLKLVLY